MPLDPGLVAQLAQINNLPVAQRLPALRELARSLSAAADPGRTALLFSGEFRFSSGAKLAIHSSEIAREMVRLNPDLTIINDTPLGKLLESTEFESALRQALTDPDDFDRLLGSANFGPDGLPESFWGEGSQRFVQSIDGPIVNLTGNASATRVFGQIELAAAMANPRVTTIAGLSKDFLATLTPLEQLQAIKATSMAASAKISIGFGDMHDLNGSVIMENGQPVRGPFIEVPVDWAVENGLEPGSFRRMNSTFGRFTDAGSQIGARRMAALFESSVDLLAGKAILKRIGKSLPIIGAGVTLYFLGADSAEAAELYRAGDNRGANIKTGEIIGGLVTGGIVGTVTTPLLAFGPPGWIAYGVINIGAGVAGAIIGGEIGAGVGQPKTVPPAPGPTGWIWADLDDLYPDYNGPINYHDFKLPPGFEVNANNTGVIETATRKDAFIAFDVTTHEDGSKTIDRDPDGLITPSLVVSLRNGTMIRIDYLKEGDNGERTKHTMVLHTDGKRPAAEVSEQILMGSRRTVPIEELGLISEDFKDFEDPAKADAYINEVEVREGILIQGLEDLYDMPIEELKFEMPDLMPAVWPVFVAPNEILDAIVHGAEQVFRLDAVNFASAFGSVIGRRLGGSNPYSQMVVSAALSTALIDLAQIIKESFNDGKTKGPTIDFGADFWAALQSEGKNAISSYLIGELVSAFDIEGDAGQFANSAASAVINQIAANLSGSRILVDIATGAPIRDAVTGLVQSAPTSGPLPAGTSVADRPWNLDLDISFATAAASFIGGKIADEIIEFETVGGQIGSTIGAIYGGFNAAAILQAGASTGNPYVFVIAVIAVVVWKVIGGLIGTWIGGTPKSGVALSWNEAEERFTVGAAWSKHGGSKDSVRAMASNVVELLNGVTTAAGAKILNPGQVRLGAFETKGKDFIYKAFASGPYAFSSRDIGAVIAHGQLIALSDLAGQLAGGDVWAKRAINATVASFSGPTGAAFSVDTLSANLLIANEYRRYRANKEVIDASIALAPQSADSIGWLATLAMAQDLGLDRRHATDWLGGWGLYLDETFDGISDGAAFSPALMMGFVTPDTMQRLFVFGNEFGEVSGMTGDTIDSAAKTRVEGTAGNDIISLAFETWQDSRTVTITPEPDAETGEQYPSYQQTYTTTISGWRVQNTSGLTINGDLNGSPAAVRVAAYIDAGDGDDIVEGGDLGNDLVGGAGNDTLVGGKLDDWLIGGTGHDRLFAGAANYQFSVGDAAAELAAVGVNGGNGDYLDGGEGDDVLYGSRGSDWLEGGEGADRLIGGSGGDILHGGAGNDSGANGSAAILGGAGSDQYIFGFGDETDVIFDESDPAGVAGYAPDTLHARYANLNAGVLARNWAGGGDYEADGSVRGGEDAIAFGAGVSLANLRIRRSESAGGVGNDLIIQLTALDPDTGNMVLTGDELVIKDWFESTRRVEWLRFANGEEFRLGDVNSFIVGSGQNDVVIGTAGSDFIAAGAGNDVVFALAGADFVYGDGGNDLISGDEDNDLVMGGSGQDRMFGATGNDTVFGDAGDDTVDGGAGSDILVGGKGNDTIRTGAGDDIIRYARGDGQDIILDAIVDNWDTVWVGGANPSFVNGYTLGSSGVTKDGVTYFDGSGWINGEYEFTYGDQTLRRHMGAVNGVLNAQAGNDAIEFAVGVNIQDLRLRQVGGDLQIAVSRGEGDVSDFDSISDRLTIKDWYTIGATIEAFAFAATGRHLISGWNLAGGGEGADVFTGGAQTDWYTGGGGDDVIDGQDGDDILLGNHGADTLRGGAGIDVIYGGEGNDILEGGEGKDILIGGDGMDIASFESAAAGVEVYLGLNGGTGPGNGDTYYSIEGLRGSAFSDKLVGDDADNQLEGGAGADLLIGGAGDDTYVLAANGGDDVIEEGALELREVVSTDGTLNTQDFEAQWDVIQEGGPPNQFEPTFWAYQLTVTRIGTGEIVYQSYAMTDFVSMSPMSMPGPSGWPGEGRWQNVQGSGSGWQMVYITPDLEGEGGEDTLELADGVGLLDIAAARSGANGEDLQLTYHNGGTTLIRNHLGRGAVESLVLSDGLVANLGQVRLAGETTGIESELVLGTAGADTLSGLGGDDVIAGGDGADTLLGGDGADVLEGGAGADTLDGGADGEAGAIPGASGDTARYAGSDAGVAIDLAARTASGGHASGDVIVAAGGVSTIENVTGSQYADALRGDARANVLRGMAGDDYLDGRDGDDALMGDDGADELHGGAGNDSLVGGAGEDTIYGDAGDDIIDGGEGAGHLFGGDGDDTLIAGDQGSDQRGGAGKDKLVGGAGADTLYGEDGDDALYGDGGNDTIFGGAGNDVISGGGGINSVAGGAGNDDYVAAAADGVTHITDNEGTNRILIADAPSSQLWITQSGNDLRIRAASSSLDITVDGYFSAGGSRVREVQASDGSIFLSHASPFIAAMTSAAVGGIPAQMPENVAAMVADYWHADGKAAPVVADQAAALAEDTIATGAVNADDHDDNITAYRIFADPSHGVASVSAAGVWSYAPAADYFGEDTFTVEIEDADGHKVRQVVSLTITDVNDAPTVGAAGPFSVDERNGGGDAVFVGQVTAGDIDDVPSAIFFNLLPDGQGRFQIDNQGVIRLKEGVSLDYEQGHQYTVTVRAEDAAGAIGYRDVIINVRDINEAPTNLTLSTVTPSAPETPSVATAIKVADIVLTDDALGSNVFTLEGADAAAFEIIGGSVYLKAGVALDFETKPVLQALVRSTDATLPGSPSITSPVSFAVINTNDAPTAVSLSQVVTSLDETTLATALKVADITVTDDALGSNALSLEGADGALFEISGNAVYLRAGITLNYEQKSHLNAVVRVTDPNIAGFAGVTQSFSVTVNDVNEGPTALNVTPVVTTLAENTSTASAIKVADLAIVDDALGTNTFSLTGADAGAFEIVGSSLYLKAGTALNYEAKSHLDVNVRVNDATIPGGAGVETPFSLAISDVNEAPTAVVISTVVASVAETPNVASAIKVADLAVTDDALGSNALSLEGADAAFFQIIGGALYLKAGQALNYEAKASLSVTVRASDAALGGAGATSTFTLAITDVNEAPGAPTLPDAVSIIVERDRPASGQTLDPLSLGHLAAVDPDGAATENAALVFSITDSRFEIVNGNELRLKAGVALDFEAGPTVSVTVTVADRLGGAGSLSATQTFTFDVGDAVDYLYGSNGADTLAGQQGVDEIRGFGGADSITGNAGADRLYGGDGADSIQAGSGNDQLYGEEDNDTLSGGDGDDLLDGGGGADTIDGGAGNDTLLGGAANDVLDGGDGADQLDGGANDDTLRGGAGDDRLVGGDGNDVLEGGAGADRIVGGAGYDILSYQNATSGVTLSLAAGTGTGGDAAGDIFEDLVEEVVGSEYGDSITGSNQGDIIRGAGGDDVLHGGDGEDLLEGGDGNDTLYAEGDGDQLIGGAGNDILDGAEGSDTYRLDANSGADTIRDFDAEGNDSDAIGYAGVDAQHLWFRRIGNDLEISVIGSSSSARIEGWWTPTPPPGNRQIEFMFAGDMVTMSASIDQLVAFMASETSVPSEARRSQLFGDANFVEMWRQHWGLNAGPSLNGLDIARSTPEDVQSNIAFTVGDDWTPVTGLRVEVATFADAGLTTGGGSLLGATVTGTDANRNLNLAPVANASGEAWVRVRVFDGADRMVEKVFQVSVTPQADVPVVAATGPFSGSFDDDAQQSIDIAISAAPTDPSETLAEVFIYNLPGALSLNRGVRLGDGRWRMTGAEANAAGLKLIGPVGYAADLTGGAALSIVAVSLESNGSLAASASRPLEVTINARPNTPTAAGYTLVRGEGNLGGQVVTTISATDPDGNTPTLIVDWNHAELLLAGNTVKFQDWAAIDFEYYRDHGWPPYLTDADGDGRMELPFNIQIKAGDGQLNSGNLVVMVYVEDVNEVPTDLWSDRTLNYNEGAYNNQILAYFGRADQDAGDSATYSLLNNAGGRFSIDNNGTLRGGATVLNYEEGAVYAILVRVTDSGGLTYDEWFNVTVNNVNEAPYDLWADRELRWNEGNYNTTPLAWFGSADIDAGNTASYSLLNDAGGRFTLDANGLLRGGPTTINYEEGAAYNILVRITDQGALTYDEWFTVNVNNVNEAPYDLWADRTLTWAEGNLNGAWLAWFGRADVDAGDGVTYSLFDSAGGRYAMRGDGLLMGGGTPTDFEAATGHWIGVRATDSGGLSYDEYFWVAVTNVNEVPTDIWADRNLNFNEANYGGGGLAWFGASDPDAGDSITYSLYDSAGGRMGMRADGLLLGYNMDFEGGSAFWIGVRATDASGAYRDEAFLVTLNNVNEAPYDIWPDRNLVFAENRGNGEGLAWFGRADVDAGDGFTFSLYDSAGGRYSMRSDGLLMGGPTNVDYEAGQGYWIGVRVTDSAGAYYDEAFYVGVANVNEAPYDIWPDRTLVWNEGNYYGQGLAWFGRADVDAGDGVTFSLFDDAGGRYIMRGDGLLIGGPTSTDAEAAGGHWLGVRATDSGGAYYDEYFWVGVGDINEAPAYGGPPSYAVWENSPAGLQTYIGQMAQPWDPDVNPAFIDFRYQMLSDDHGRYWMNSTGGIYLQNPADYEAGGYDGYFWVRTWDGGAIGAGNYTDTPVYINVLNQNEAPTRATALDYSGWPVRLVGATDPENNITGYVVYNAWEHFEGSIFVPHEYGEGHIEYMGAYDTYIGSPSGWVDAQGYLYPQQSWSGYGWGMDYFLWNFDVATIDAGGLQSNTIHVTMDVWGGATLSPVIFDLNGDGIELNGWGVSNVRFDQDGDGKVDVTGWFGASDGMLVLDRNGDGAITTGSEISFTGDLPGATTDLEGLAAYDSNADGVLDKADARFGEFMVWRDANQDGVSDKGELYSLTDIGISSIDLKPKAYDGEVTSGNDVTNTSSFTRLDGSTGLVGDVLLSYRGSKPRAWITDETGAKREITEIGLNNFLSDIIPPSAAAQLAEQAEAAMRNPQVGELEREELDASLSNPVNDDLAVEQEQPQAAGPSGADEAAAAIQRAIAAAAASSGANAPDIDPTIDRVARPDAAASRGSSHQAQYQNVAFSPDAWSGPSTLDFGADGVESDRRATERRRSLQSIFDGLRNLTADGGQDSDRFANLVAQQKGGALHASLGGERRRAIAMVDAMSQFSANEGAADLRDKSLPGERKARELLTTLPDIRSL